MSPRKLTDRRQRRTRRALFWALAVALLGYGLFMGDHRPHHLALLWLEERRTEERIDDLAESRAELEARLAAVEDDPLALEELAREKGMVRPGDLVYRIVPVSPDVRQEAAESLAVRAAREPNAPEETESAAGVDRGGPRPAGPAGAGEERGVVAPDPEAPDPEPADPATNDPRWRWLDEPLPTDPVADADRPGG